MNKYEESLKVIKAYVILLLPPAFHDLPKNFSYSALLCPGKGGGRCDQLRFKPGSQGVCGTLFLAHPVVRFRNCTVRPTTTFKKD